MKPEKYTIKTAAKADFGWIKELYARTWSGDICVSQGIKMKKYLIVFEKPANNFSAYLPDLPGCIATGKTRAEVEKISGQRLSFIFKE